MKRKGLGAAGLVVMAAFGCGASDSWADKQPQPPAGMYDELHSLVRARGPGDFSVHSRSNETAAPFWRGPEFQPSDDQPAVVFGAIADVQYCDCAPWKRRHYRESAAKLRAAMHDFAESGADFVVQLGDLIERGIESFAPVVFPYAANDRMPLFHVLGNHDWAVKPEAKDEVLLTLGLQRHGYYSFLRRGWRFVVLDGTEVSIYATEKDTPERAAAEALLELLRSDGAPNAQTRNGAVSAQQLQWLHEELQTAEVQGERAIVFGHFPVYPPEGGHNLWNDFDVRGVLERFGGVVAAYVSGHDHRGAYAMHGGIHYLTLHGVIDGGSSSCSALFLVHDDRIEVLGAGRQPSYELNTLRSE